MQTPDPVKGNLRGIICSHGERCLEHPKYPHLNSNTLLKEGHSGQGCSPHSRAAAQTSRVFAGPSHISPYVNEQRSMERGKCKCKERTRRRRAREAVECIPPVFLFPNFLLSPLSLCTHTTLTGVKGRRGRG